MNKTLELLEARGFLEWCSDLEGLSEEMDKGPITLYSGFDPTADSLHVGHLIPVMCACWMQRTGHRPLLLAGGGTGMIGDPSGKSKERNLLSPEQIAHNVECVKKQLASMLDFTPGPQGAKLVNNYDWLGKINLIDFLRDVGKHFSVNVMIRKEHVRSRIEDPDKTLSFTEFTYTILQGYDFLHLFETEGCRLQMGGNDQQGNLVSGLELIRKVKGERVFAATSPLLLNSNGVKFGKTEEGAVWLDPARTSPYKFYQFWVNTEDDQVEKLLKLYTFLSLEEIAELVSEHQANPGARAASRALAFEVTKLIHGQEAAQAAQKASALLFGGGAEGLDDATLAMVTEETGAVPYSQGQSLADALVDAGVVASKGEVKRLVAGGAVSVGGVKISDERACLADEHFGGKGKTLLRLGKKKYFVLTRS